MPSYELTGSGESRSYAERDLCKKHCDLTSKLKNERVDNNVSNYSDFYSASYSARQDVRKDLDCPEFTVQSKKSWDDLVPKAERRANGGKLSSYNVSMTITRNYVLTNEQLKAATQVGRRSTPACLNDENNSYLAGLLKKI